MAGRITVLIIGGYGAFGARLVELLKDEPRLTLIITGRTLARAKALCLMDAAAELVPAEFDRDGDVGAQISRLDPDIVVDASGPFQGYGNDPYRVVRAAIAAGADYVDLADATDFVLGISHLDDEAKAAGKFALAGLSTCPALTCAVVRELARDLDDVDSICAGIAPSPHAEMGYSVIRAILSYAGQPVDLVRDGKPDTAPGLVDSCAYTITMPGRIPLAKRLFALVNVPDLKVLQTAWPQARDIWFGAGTEPAVLFRLLNIAATLVHRRIMPSLGYLAPIVNRIVDTFRSGAHRGGMFVDLTGRDGAGQVYRRRWHLVADGDSGPYIPTMAAVAVIRRCLAGVRPEPGVRPASNELELADFEPLFGQKDISTAILNGNGERTVFQRVLGDRCSDLPKPIQALHDLRDHAVYAGRGRVERGTNTIARIIARVFKFPEATDDVAVDVDMTVEDGVETWQRRFGEAVFHSTLEVGSGRYEGLVVERWGPMSFGIALVERDGRLLYILQRWDALGLPMPRRLAPEISAFEHDAGNRFNFSVRIALPMIGLLAGYHGWLEKAG